VINHRGGLAVESGLKDTIARGFTLNTSGAVALPHRNEADQTFVSTLWSDLSPFAQGYIEALLRDVRAALHCGRLAGRDRIHYPAYHPRAFSDLAPEALVLILKDCAAFTTYAREVCAVDYERSKSDGEWFWHARQKLEWMDSGYPRLAPYLREDGKVDLRETQP